MNDIDGGLGYGTEKGVLMKVLRLGEPAAPRAAVNLSTTLAARTPSPFPEDRRGRPRGCRLTRGMSTTCTRPTSQRSESHARSVLDKASTLAESRNLKRQYRYVIWPSYSTGVSSRGGRYAARPTAEEPPCHLRTSQPEADLLPFGAPQVDPVDPRFVRKPARPRPVSEDRAVTRGRCALCGTQSWISSAVLAVAVPTGRLVVLRPEPLEGSECRLPDGLRRPDDVDEDRH